MFENKKIIALAGVELLCLIGGIRTYGKLKYNNGKIDAAKEILDRVEKVKTDATKDYWKKKVQEARKKEIRRRSLGFFF